MTKLQKDFKVLMESCGVNATSLIALDAWRIYKAATERAAGIIQNMCLHKTPNLLCDWCDRAEAIRGEELADD